MIIRLRVSAIIFSTVYLLKSISWFFMEASIELSLAFID